LEVTEWPDAPVQLRGLCESDGVVLQALKIQAKAAMPTGRLELTIGAGLSRVMAVLSAVNTDSRVKEIGAVMRHL
jgi:hypothetical protein